MPPILVHEETLDPGYVPPSLPGREREYRTLEERYRTRLGRGVPYHTLVTGGVGSGKTALARRLSEDLRQRVKIGGLAVHPLYVNCWRRASDRTVLLDLLRGVGVSLPDRGYGLSEMLDVFEQGIRRDPRHLLVVLDEVGALVRQGTKLVYLLSRAREVGLGSISLLLIAPQDVLPFLDAASRSSFGVTHRLHLAPYDAPALEVLLSVRAKQALRPGSFSPEVIAQIAKSAAGAGDARFALEVLSSAAQAAESAGRDEITAEDIRAAKGSIAPTLTEEKLTGLSATALLVLLGLARSLKGSRTNVTTEKARQAYAVVAEEHGAKPMSRVTFWRTVKELERDGLVDVEAAAAGQSARLAMNELPASTLELLVEERIQPPGSRKR
ncbi:MAG: orc1/cdc6 family replication initiation protein [Thermoplasmata archaeon]|nr:orc1/cdc6 family replication initiation protein [Thermoplasmata archaeon]